MDHEQAPPPAPVGKRGLDQAGTPLVEETFELLEILALLTPSERQIVLTTGRMLHYVRNGAN